MKFVLALANTPYFSDVEREVLQRIVNAIGHHVREAGIPCVACMTSSVGITFPDSIAVRVGQSTKAVIEPGDVILSQYSTLVFDLRDYKNKLVLVNNKATSFLLSFPWVISHELQVPQVLLDVVQADSPMQAIWAIVNGEDAITSELAKVAQRPGRLQWAFKALIDRLR